MPDPRQKSKETHPTQESKEITHLEKKHHSTYSLVSAFIASIAEVSVFHPVDTTTKRLMNAKQPFTAITNDFQKAITDRVKTAITDPKSNHISFYPGIRWALSYKILQRTYKFGGQPIVESALESYCNTIDNNTFGRKFISGSIMGIGEVILLPLDIYKIRNQTGSPDNGFSYRGLGPTITRNLIGSGALFSIPYLIKSLFPDQKESGIQTIIANGAGAIASLIFSHPFDVVKTRMQSNKNTGGFWKVTIDITTINPKQFGRGLGVKLLTQSPKLTFFMFAQREIVNVLEKSDSLKRVNGNEEHKPQDSRRRSPGGL